MNFLHLLVAVVIGKCYGVSKTRSVLYEKKSVSVSGTSTNSIVCAAKLLSEETSPAIRLNDGTCESLPLSWLYLPQMDETFDYFTTKNVVITQDPPIGDITLSDKNRIYQSHLPWLFETGNGIDMLVTVLTGWTHIIIRLNDDVSDIVPLRVTFDNVGDMVDCNDFEVTWNEQQEEYKQLSPVILGNMSKLTLLSTPESIEVAIDDINFYKFAHRHPAILGRILQIRVFPLGKVLLHKVKFFIQ